MPSAGRVEADGQGGRVGVLGERPAPVDVERGVHLGQGHLAAGEAECGASERGAPAVALALELGVAGPLLEEVGVGHLQVPQGLLERDAGHVVEEGQVGLFLPGGHGAVLGWVADGLLAVGPGFAPLGERLVVDQANAPERPAQEVLLGDGRIEAVSEASQTHTRIVSRFGVKSNVVEAALPPPPAEDGEVGASAPEKW